MTRKKIAVITARADDAAQQTLLRGVAEAAFSAGAHVAVYSNIYNHWTDDELLNQENAIYSMFDARQYDGVIVTCEPFRDLGVIGDVLESIRRAGVPAVALDGKIEGFLSLSTDDEADLERLTEHLIIDHDLKRIDILTGSREDPVARQRLRGCVKALEKHGISVEESHIHYGNFWTDSGRQLAERYLSGDIPMPQAVVCTNDHMAYGLCDALTDAGVMIPQQLTITGYDYTSGLTNSRIYHFPFLTTWRRDRRKLGADAVSLLLGKASMLIREDRFVPGNTCACGAKRRQMIEELRTERIDRDHRVASSVAQFSSRLTLCRTIAEYTNVLGNFFDHLHGAKLLYFCLDTAWNSGVCEGSEFLCCPISKNSAEQQPLRLSAADEIPAWTADGEHPVLCYFSPICFQQRMFGFTVLTYDHPAGYDFSFRDWNKAVANTLEFLRMKNDIHYLEQCQKASTLYDSLTGFYNLAEFRRQVAVYEERGVLYAVRLSCAQNGEFIYGESFRTDVVSLVAKAIKQACTNREIFCRADENTFLIYDKGENLLFPAKLRAQLNHVLAGKCDERQALITLVDEPYQSCMSSMEAVQRKADEQSAQALLLLTQRQSHPHYDALIEIRNAVYAKPQNAPSLEEASKRLCFSEGYFRAVYKRCFGISYNQECIQAKLLKACHLLATTAMSVFAVASACGYGDEKFFTRQFRQNMGYAPLEYRKLSCRTH